MCALAKCSSGVPDSDPNKPLLVASEQRGQGYLAEQQQIKDANAFRGYGGIDATNDGLTRNDQALTRLGGGARMVTGAAGAAGSAIAAGVAAPLCVSIVGCAAPVGLAGLGVLSANDAGAGSQKAFGPYQSFIGDQVRASFDPATYPGEQSPLLDLAIGSGTAFAEMLLQRWGAKLLPRPPKEISGKKAAPEPVKQSSPNSAEQPANQFAIPPGEKAPQNSANGAENIATYAKLKGQLAKQNLENIAAQDSRLANTVKGSATNNVNFSIGRGTAAEADQLGKIWVGNGAKRTADGTGWVSADGMRVYRAPTVKLSQHATTGVQANFEIYSINPITGEKLRVSNGT